MNAAPGRCRPDQRPPQFAVGRAYGVIVAMGEGVVAVVVGWTAVNEVQQLSQPRAAQSVWHVYQTHEAVQRVAAPPRRWAPAAPARIGCASTWSCWPRRRPPCASSACSICRSPEFARAWMSIEQRTSEGIAAIDRAGKLEPAEARRIAEQFGALRDTSRFLLVAAQQEANRARDSFRSRLIERFWQAAAAMSVLFAGLLFLLRRARVGGTPADRAGRQPARAEPHARSARGRTHAADRGRPHAAHQIVEASPSAIALLRCRDDMPLFFNARMRQMLGVDMTPTSSVPAAPAVRASRRGAPVRRADRPPAPRCATGRR